MLTDTGSPVRLVLPGGLNAQPGHFAFRPDAYNPQVLDWSVLSDTGSPVRLVLLVSLNLALTYLNYRGLHIVGNVAVATAVFTLLPFAVITGLGKFYGGALVVSG